MSGAIANTFGAAPVLSNLTLISDVPNTQNPLCSINFLTSGGMFTVDGPVPGGLVTFRLPAWWGQNFSAPANIADPFQIRLEVAAGTAPNTGSSDPINTWINMSAGTALWELFRNTAGTTTGTWDVFIRNRFTGQIIATARYQLICTKDP